ncbi:Os03g0615700, partial [Oryza sativa Japonica Group]
WVGNESGIFLVAVECNVVSYGMELGWYCVMESRMELC